MSGKDFDSLRNVNKGRNDWKVRVRVIREWRGVTTTGIVFKTINYLFLDNKNCRMHAFVPVAFVEKMSRLIVEGNVYVIKNFSVKDYTEKDKYRPVQMEQQIIFTADTKVKEVDEKNIFIPKNSFDLFEYDDLKPMTKQVLYLTDVIGILEKIPTISRVPNKQVKIKFKITDGRKKINVTFWSTFAEEFDRAVHENLEEPIIIIISSARVTSWNDQLDISNYSPTRFYINYEHHSVAKLRNKLKDPMFSTQKFATRNKPIKICTIQEIRQLSTDYCDQQVVCKATIKSVQHTAQWKKEICSSCYSETEFKNNEFFCQICKKIVPETLKRYHISAVVQDTTGELQIVLQDREMRIVTGKRVEEVQTEGNSFPKEVETLEGEKYTFRLLIKQENIEKTSVEYMATGIIIGWEYETELGDTTEAMQSTYTSTTQQTGPSYHLDEISQMNNSFE